MDKWDRETNFTCISCMYCVPKKKTAKEDEVEEGRCRRHAPTLQGYPVVKLYDDWCGDHKLGSNPVIDRNNI